MYIVSPVAAVFCIGLSAFGCLSGDEVWLGTNNEKEVTLEATSTSSHLPTLVSDTLDQCYIQQTVYILHLSSDGRWSLVSLFFSIYIANPTRVDLQ